MNPRTDLVVRTAVVVTTALAIIGLARLLTHVVDVLIGVLIAAILATGVAPLASRLEEVRWGRQGGRLSRTWAIFFIFLLVFVVITAMTAAVVTPVVIEAQGFLENLPGHLQRLQAAVQEWKARYSWLPDFGDLVRRLPNELDRLGNYFAPAAGVALRVFGGLATVVTVVFLAFYMLVEGPKVKTNFLALFPRRRREDIANVLERVGAKFGGWVRGQLLLGFIIGAAAGVGVTIIGLPFPLLLAIFAGTTELIPMVGPIIGAIPAVFLALFQPTWKLIFVIAWYAFIQQAESNFVVPRVMRYAVGLSPLLTIIALIVGAKLLGAVGALLAVPVAAALQVVVSELVRQYGPAD
ncbi:MAG TPA: AI-2E family transporter [bacterium]